MNTLYRPMRKSQPAWREDTTNWNVPSAGGAASFPSATSCPTNSGRGRSLKSPPAQKPARSEPIAVHATSGIQSSCRQRATAGISTIQKSLPAPRQENTTPTAGIALRARGAPQNLPRVTFGLPGSKYSLPAPLRAIPKLSATTAARMGGPPRRPPRDTASASGLPRRRPPAQRKASKSGSVHNAVRRRQNRLPKRATSLANGLPRRRPPAWKKASKSGSVRNAV